LNRNSPEDLNKMQQKMLISANSSSY